MNEQATTQEQSTDPFELLAQSILRVRAISEASADLLLLVNNRKLDLQARNGDLAAEIGILHEKLRLAEEAIARLTRENIAMATHKA